MNPISVLIVDDSEDDRYILTRQLKETKIPISQIFECSEGASALRFFVDFEKNVKRYSNGYPPTFVFLDINMPLMDGFEFLEEFKKIQVEKGLDPIVIMFSSSDRKEDVDRATEFSIVKAYLVKGKYDIDQLKSEMCISNGDT
ncbi:response regulator [Pseudoalteromonas luteoviolacea]|uniref:response regulator n=1 Tax=Pseudoalteromonas luteoviolacea TaxID=43657 RepID=UPI001B360A66|nr:response regulator [Pseudoalteromonas luteoviolacea]MBQ4811170.1 response regulator [Pseudoalteromonas luteoviolacea]